MSRSAYEPGCIFVDVDGTLTKSKWRESWLPSKNKNVSSYKIFEDLGEFDLPNHEIMDLVFNLQTGGYKIIILTGRSEVCRHMTKVWLRKHGIEYDWLYMRPKGDLRGSPEYKMSVVQQYYKEEVKMIIDDRQDVIEAFKFEGYPTYKVDK